MFITTNSYKISKFINEQINDTDIKYTCNIAIPEQFESNIFIDDIIKQTLRDKKFCQYKYISPILNLELYAYQDKLDTEVIIELIKLIYKFVYATTQFYNYKRTVNLYVYLTPNRKTTEGMINNTFDALQINSGSTLFGDYGEQIELWREEELLKVLVHELIHYMNIDFKLGHFDMVKMLKNIFNVNGTIKPYEGYTEVEAIILHSFIVAYMNNVPPNDILTTELNFSLFQVAKILRLSDIKEFKDIYKQTQTTHTIKQKTSVFSYFLVKTAFLLHAYELILYDENHKDKHDLKELYKIIMTGFENPLYNDAVNYFINLSVEDPYLNNTMRMSAIELSYSSTCLTC